MNRETPILIRAKSAELPTPGTSQRPNAADTRANPIKRQTMRTITPAPDLGLVAGIPALLKSMLLVPRIVFASTKICCPQTHVANRHKYGGIWEMMRNLFKRGRTLDPAAKACIEPLPFAHLI
ncbi:hypothetical protein [Thalassococcus lentus]|uniref:Uncharacterized protein n=1 Tax=Thalassococcus lentus TaxID=1210524 RepID=A0ABT4XRZ0_9RHOB|nr:hypothetical protein [Thalassococcus lentus]MDA7424724.1 hypothetical protein [Thalassococcus lentus]